MNWKIWWKIFRNKNILSIFISILILIIIFTISSFWLFYHMNKKVHNFYYELLKANVAVSNEIIIAEIDEKTIWALGRFPFDRSVYVPFINNLKDAEVWTVAFDIVFADKSDTVSDNLFAQALQEVQNVVFWFSLSNQNRIEYPLNIFLDGIIWMGFFSVEIDKKTNTVYAIKPVTNFISWKSYEHFSIAILKAYYNYIYNNQYKNFQLWSRDNNFYITPNISIPFAKKWSKEVLINYASRHKFKRVSFIDVYDKNSFEVLQRNNVFKDKIVIVWATVKAIKDVFNTPSWIEYGVYVHANMINTILTRSFLTYFDTTLEWILIFLLVVLSVYFNLSRSGYILIFSNIAIVIIFLIIFPASIIIFTNLILNYAIELIFALVFSLTFTNIAKYLIENKHKQKLNKALSEYVSEDVAHEILSWEWKVNLDGENKRTAIFFSDIEWFTSISEKFTPEVLVWFLREYLSKMSNIILDEKWFINKYEWDAVMALWWVFGTDENASYHACLSSIKQQRLLKTLNIDWKERGFSEIKVRIWLHTWEAIIWNIWSEGRKMEFTALWDSVNLASRMEGVNKFYGTYICVSEDIYAEVKEKFEFRYLDKIRVKWKEIGVNIYELIEEKWNTTEEQQDIFKQFQKGIQLYLARDFEEALQVFSTLERLWDKPSVTYKTRCEMYIKNPPDESWDQIWTMDSK